MLVWESKKGGGYKTDENTAPFRPFDRCFVAVIAPLQFLLPSFNPLIMCAVGCFRYLLCCKYF